MAFIFGSRPTAADFAIYGQLRQLATDPLPSRILGQGVLGFESLGFRV